MQFCVKNTLNCTNLYYTVIEIERMPGGRKMPLHTILIKPASGLCNMRCDYCFYCDEMDKREQAFRGMMSEDTVKNLIRKAMRQADREILLCVSGRGAHASGNRFFQKSDRV